MTEKQLTLLLLLIDSLESRVAYLENRSPNWDSQQYDLARSDLRESFEFK